MVQAMIETHECLWCRKSIEKTSLFCCADCVKQYNKHHKTKKDIINWTYIEEQRPGTRTKIGIATLVMAITLYLLQLHPLEQLVIVVLYGVYYYRKITLK